MAKRELLRTKPEFVNTLFGLEPAPLSPAYLRLVKAGGGETKFCTWCKQDVSIGKFCASKMTKDRHHLHCNPCRNEQARTRYHRGIKAKKRVTDVHRLRNYGLTPQAFEAWLTTQNNECAICQTTLKPKGRQTHIDHCHKTGRLRAILCMPCNMMVGVVENLPADIEKYQTYLSRHSG